MKRKEHESIIKTSLTDNVIVQAKNLIVDIAQFYILIHGFISVVLIVLLLKIYEYSIISISDLMIPFCFGTILELILITLFYGRQLKWYWTFNLSLFIGGISGIYIFLFTNQYYKESTTVVKEFIIQNRGTMGTYKNKCAAPYAEINIQGIDKRITFLCEENYNFHQYKKIQLHLITGYWGIDVIDDSQLIK